MTPRQPIVAIMGHIDHGKSTLLDYIRKTNTTDKEAGGITQHLAAYEIAEGITFLDTPGHEAFQTIRERGAKAADIAVLVVAADEGVKPQTVEALNKINESKVPMIVAITKIDRPNADIEKVKQSLAESGIYVEGYGGDVPVVAVSGKTGEGIKEFLELIKLVGEVEQLRGDKGRWGTGNIIESRRDPKKGIIATGVIKDGTVKVGQFVASAGAVASLRFMLTTEGKQVDELSFSSPVLLTGWDKLPFVGAPFEIFEDKKAAQLYADSEAIKAHIPRRTKEEAMPEGSVHLPLILKADTAGSLEAIHFELNSLSRDRIRPQVVSAEIGSVNESDVKGALTVPGTVILSFHVRIDAPAASLAERSKVDIESFDIIYKLKERVQELLMEREPRIEVEEIRGRAKVLKCFSQNRDKQVLGARVETGMVEKNANVRIIRRESDIGRGKVRELQQAKMSADSIQEGSEFGAMIESKTEIAPGDILESIVLVTK